MFEVPSANQNFQTRIRFHQPHLERVSRSFAFGIARLEPRLRALVGLGYLICRILDTVEDAAWPKQSDQASAFAQFNRFLIADSIAAREVRDWVELFPNTISSGETLLLNDAHAVFTEFTSLEPRDRDAMLEPILSMSRGMAAYAARGFGLKSLADVNVYCFFVAGVVGELLTGLIEAELRPIGLKLDLRLATHFGLFLQKVNVLKDQASDENEGRFLIPDRELVLASLRANADGAFAYLKLIPTANRDYRLFCAWALYLGLATVPVLRAKGLKLSRLEAAAIGARIEFAISNNEKLESLFDELVAKAWPTPAHVPTASASEARVLLGSLYSGRMNLDDLALVLAGQETPSPTI